MTSSSNEPALQKSVLTLAGGRRLRPRPSLASLIKLRSYSLPECPPTGCTILLVRHLVAGFSATSRQSLTVKNCTLFRHLNRSVAASAAWSDGHSPPLGGGSVLSRFFSPMSSMSSTRNGGVCEKIMSMRSYNSLRWFSRSPA